MNRTQRRPITLRVEALEERCVLAASIVPDQLLLTSVTGQVSTVKLAEGQSADDAIAAYGKDASIAAVERAQVVSVSVLPNDTSFASQYSLSNTGQTGGTSDADIDADQAWDTTTGSLKIAVGIIDTGIDYRHPDLYLNIWLNQGEIPTALGVVDTNSDGIITFHDLNASANSTKVSDLNSNGYIDAGDLLNDSRWENGLDEDNNGKLNDLIGWDFVNNDNDPLDDNQHGTHVAGTIGAMANNGRGVAGVAWNVRMAALKFLAANGSGSTAGALDALNYAVAKGMQLSNNSWGGGGYSSAMNTAINNARSAGHVFVAAAGNSATNNDTTANYPSNYSADNVVAVASTDHKDLLSSFSNYGATQVDLAAPGSGIYSTLPNNRYGSLSGTSMATPHVTGALALVWSADTTQSYSTVISRVLQNVDTVSGLSGKVATGGRLNVAKAVAAAANAVTAPRVVSATPNSGSAPTSVRVTFNKAVDPATFTLADVTNFVGPNGAISATSVAAVAGTNNTQFDVKFAAQAAAGSYRLDIGPDVRDTAGRQMDQNQNGTAGEAGDYLRVTFSVVGQTTYTSTTQAAIKDFATASTAITVGQGVTIADVNVKVNIKHTYDSDLQIYLVGPDGTRVNLSNYRGGSGDNYTNTTFDDQAATAISAGAAPFSGTYRPDAALSAYNNKSSQGTWRLYVYDGARYDTGTLLGWSLSVTAAASASARALDADGAVEVAMPPVAATPSPGAAAFVLPSLTVGSLTASALAEQGGRVAGREAVPFNAEVAIARREAADAVFAVISGERVRHRALWGDDAFGWASE